MRRVKILATIGPASCSPETIRAMMDAGADGFRFNFSHGDRETHARCIATVRAEAEALNRPVSLVQDLQGVKIRTGALEDGQPVELVEGETFTITTEPVTGNAERVSTTYGDLPRDVRPGQQILLADGEIELEVLAVEKTEIRCRIISGGTLAETQGINLPGTDISAPPLTDKDLSDLRFGLEQEFDFVALSFVRSVDDVEALRNEIRRLEADTPIIAKIEKPEAVDCLDEILEAADGIMLARGDLGVEIPPEQVPVVQKQAVRKARQQRRLCIIATQMLDSMTSRPLPTRAEASDVANAVFDGADTLMLSGETAVGRYPVRTVSIMARIIQRAETVTSDFQRAGDPIRTAADVPHALCEAAASAAERIAARAIVAFTQSGFTAWLMSSYRSTTPILGFSTQHSVVRRLALAWGVRPGLMDPVDNVDQLISELDGRLLSEGLAAAGDRVVIIGGAPIIARGPTNLMELHEVDSRRRDRED